MPSGLDQSHVEATMNELSCPGASFDTIFCKYDVWSCPRYILILNLVEAIPSNDKPICLNHIMWSFSESLRPRICNKIHNTFVWP